MPELSKQQGVRVAIEGCGHGTLNDIYASVEHARKEMGWTGVDLLIIGGDFQSVRNIYDLNCVNVPLKYRHMGDFHEYYSGVRTAPYLTIFVGGNHEASNYLFELYFGGWVAPNIYYMGAANVLRFGPLRIFGMSGIWKGHDYRKPHHERLPYSKDDVHSIYHVRELDVRKALQIRTQVDIGISHDWPAGVEWQGNHRQLFKHKPYFEEDANNGKLGSVAAQQVLNMLRPRYWFSAHLHTEYAAVIHHEPGAPVKGSPPRPSANAEEIELDDSDPLSNGVQDTAEVSTTAAAANEEEIDLDIDSDSVESVTEAKVTGVEAARAALPEAFRRPEPREAKPPPAVSEKITNRTTRFLALDKCLPNKRFLKLQEVPASEVLADPCYEEMPASSHYKLMYDREWLAITRTFGLDEPITVGDPTAQVQRIKPFDQRAESIDQHREWIDANLSEDDLVVPENFELTASIYDHGDMNDEQYAHVREYPNPQTARFCEMIGIPNPLEISEEQIELNLRKGPTYVPPRDGSDHRRRGRGRAGNNRGGRGGYRGGNQGRGGSHRGRSNRGGSRGGGGFSNR